jgi:hypothetical protein
LGEEERRRGFEERRLVWGMRERRLGMEMGE